MKGNVTYPQLWYVAAVSPSPFPSSVPSVQAGRAQEEERAEGESPRGGGKRWGWRGRRPPTLIPAQPEQTPWGLAHQPRLPGGRARESRGRIAHQTQGASLRWDPLSLFVFCALPATKFFFNLSLYVCADKSVFEKAVSVDRNYASSLQH